MSGGSATAATAAAYGRASTDKQDQSIDAQRLALTNYARSQNLDLPDSALILEGDTSGSIPFADREKGGELLRQCLAGKYRHLIVPRIDRLGRNAIDVLNTIETLRQAGVTIHILDLGGATFNTDSAISGMIIAVLAYAAQMTLEQIRTNVRNGLAHKHSKNELCGTVPYGWNAVETGEVRVNKGGKPVKIRRLEPNPEEQQWILKMARWRACGWSYNRIARELNFDHVPTKRAGEVLRLRSGTCSEIKLVASRWQFGQVETILNNATVKSWLAERNAA